ncbi:MAG: tyrosine--tRNA ligase, partial [Candidatus Goldbacteria bacterium]|nr:tyrosine--tRNA ligase [Candidatus Goldiibacteriota bacterium]
YNSEWFNKISFEEVLKLCSKFTLAQMLEHESFEKRYKEGLPLTLLEMMYPIMQGYDSVVIRADIELGGTDQKFNVIVGRFLQREYGMEPQVGLFTPILTGLDGKNKMSKSLKNYIGINDKPEDMYGKVMSIPDELIIQYFELLTDTDAEKIREIKRAINNGQNPMEFKKMLAYNIVTKYIGKKEAEFAKEHFHKTFSEKEIPYHNYKYSWDFEKDEVTIADFLKKLKIVESNSDARRLVEQGGFYINDNRVDDFKRIIKKSEMPFTFRAGKKNFGIFE